MFGMKCFRSDVFSIGGAVKSTPLDFQVTEVDLQGKLVELNSKEETGGIDEKNEDAKSGKCQVSGAIKESVNLGKKLDPVLSEHAESFSPSLDLTKHYKSCLDGLNETFCDRISEYADRCREETCHKDEGSTTEAKISPLCLGTFHDKSQRTVLYGAVKHLFPHLKACVSDNHEMKICQDEMYTTFRSLLNEEDANNLQRFVSRRKIHEKLDLSDMPFKSTRTQVHRLINLHYGSFLESKTFTSENPGGTSDIHIQLRVKERSQGQKRKLEGCSQQQVCYTGFTLQKENLETFEAVLAISKALKVQPSDISYAGIKDKRAVTVQAVAVRLSLQRVEGLLCNLKAKGITVGNLRKRTGPITTGELWGNDFKITLRNIWLPGNEKSYANKCPMCKKCILEKHFMQTAVHLKKNGFINYFGKQRFGEEWSSPSGSLSADVGLAMLQKDYIKAVKLILSPDPIKTDAVNIAKKLFQETSDAKAALKMMPTFKARECMLLKALHRHGVEQEGCRKALLGIPHHMRQLYIHSFTSLVWNHMASQRITDDGFKVIPGDLVIPPGSKDMTKDDVILIPAGDLTEASKYTICDVVLPLPGNAITYPRHGIGQAYSDFLNSYGLGECQFRLNALQINVPGDYRRLVEFPVNLEWKIFQESGHDGSSFRELNTVSGKVGQEVCNSDFKIAELSNSISQQNDPHQCKATAIKDDSSFTELTVSEKVGQELCNTDFKITELSNSVSQQNDPQQCKATAIEDVTVDGSSDMEVKQSGKMEKGRNICDCGNVLRSVEFNLELNFSLPSSTYATSLLREVMRET